MAQWGEFSLGELIGYVPVDAEGKPFRTTRGTGYQSRKEPIKVYQTEFRANGMSPVGKCKKVYIQ